MAEISLDFADPILTANIYCGGFLDSLITDVIAPFWSRFTTLGVDQRSFLWFARYQRGGEHLKIRFHGPPAVREDVQGMLETEIRRFFTSLPAPPEEFQRDCHAGQFPVDPEDECTTAYPDRTILWTCYRRIPGIMGRQPMSDDLRHAALFSRCLGIGSTIVLEGFTPDGNGTVSSTQRLSLALKFFVAALWSLGLSPEGTLEYLYYHRDWLLTSFEIDIARACEHFDRRIQGSPATLDGLRPLMRPGRRGAESSTAVDLYWQWQNCSAELFQYMLLRADNPEFLKDPYMKDQVLATPFKLLHAHTNQLGIGFVNEGYLCQLLIRTCETT